MREITPHHLAEGRVDLGVKIIGFHKREDKIPNQKGF